MYLCPSKQEITKHCRHSAKKKNKRLIVPSSSLREEGQMGETSGGKKDGRVGRQEMTGREVGKKYRKADIP